MAFEAHRRKHSQQRLDGSWYHDPYERPEEPHHVHVPNGCTDHRPGSCPPDHWIGDRPENQTRHRVVGKYHGRDIRVAGPVYHFEFDGATGLSGYTRLSDEEQRDLALLDEFTAEAVAAEEVKVQKRVDQLKARAGTDPDFKALLEHLGIV